MYMYVHSIWCIFHSFETCSGGLQVLYKCPLRHLVSREPGDEASFSYNVELGCISLFLISGRTVVAFRWSFWRQYQKRDLEEGEEVRLRNKEDREDKK